MNPDTTLGAARRIVREDGHLVLRIPNGDIFRQGVYWLKAGGWRRSSATAALAWNSLLSFLYINDYAASTLINWSPAMGSHGWRLRWIRS